MRRAVERHGQLVQHIAAMEIIVPDAGRFEEVESALTSDMFNEIIGNMSQTSLMLNLPKFKFESSFGLSPTLSQLRSICGCSDTGS